MRTVPVLEKVDYWSEMAVQPVTPFKPNMQTTIKDVVDLNGIHERGEPMPSGPLGLIPFNLYSARKFLKTAREHEPDRKYANYRLRQGDGSMTPTAVASAGMSFLFDVVKATTPYLIAAGFDPSMAENDGSNVYGQLREDARVGQFDKDRDIVHSVTGDPRANLEFVTGIAMVEDEVIPDLTTGLYIGELVRHSRYETINGKFINTGTLTCPKDLDNADRIASPHGYIVVMGSSTRHDQPGINDSVLATNATAPVHRAFARLIVGMPRFT